jgi:hypothetical protein
LAVDLKPGAYDVTVRYLPTPFLIGAGIFSLMIAGATIFIGVNVVRTKRARELWG